MSLISAGELIVRIGDPHLRICDVRWWLTDPGKGRRDYDAAHLPGAVFVDADRDLVAVDGPGRHPLPSPADFVARMEQIGIGNDSEVVAYDDAGGAIAARLWWMLDDLGHRNVRVLDGGIAAWAAAGGPLTAQVPAPAAGPPLAATGVDPRHRSRGRSSPACSPATSRSSTPVRPSGTAVSSSPSIPCQGTSRAPAATRARTAWPLTGTSSARTMLRDRLGGLGPDVVTSCGSGVTACHTALAMRMAGLPDPILYPGSYSDWSRAGMPVVTGDEPGRYEG